MIIPQIGDWVCCQGFDLGPGKVTKINYDRNEFSADFLTEPFGHEPSCIEEIDCSFVQIEKVIDNAREMKKLNRVLVDNSYLGR